LEGKQGIEAIRPNKPLQQTGHANEVLRASAFDSVSRPLSLVVRQHRRIVMPRRGAHWREYIDAARRKLKIAEYHLEELGDKLSAAKLRGELSAAKVKENLPAPIPVQAHFEGVIIALMAAVDQVAEATNIVFAQGRWKPKGLNKRAFKKLGKELEEIREWYNKEITQDLRNVRVYMVHHTYGKDGSPMWEVEKPEDSDYQGSRELRQYASDGMEHGREFGVLLKKIEKVLAEKYEEST
jgi:hypothetical protein